MTHFDRRTLLRTGLVAGAGVAGGALLGAPGPPGWRCRRPDLLPEEDGAYASRLIDPLAPGWKAVAGCPRNGAPTGARRARRGRRGE
ncbi:hypothetical protein DRA43_10285 [Micromonospora provocatoris]|nr:hypothetical protein DRA43_10285 [Micromonospora provocatoris]